MKEKYEILWSEYADRQLNKLNKRNIERITKKLGSITSNPFKFVKRLKTSDLYSLRIGNYRIIMSIERGKVIIFVLEIGHRKNIYRKH